VCKEVAVKSISLMNPMGGGSGHGSPHGVCAGEAGDLGTRAHGLGCSAMVRVFMVLVVERWCVLMVLVVAY
jgi:hypothetical protein